MRNIIQFDKPGDFDKWESQALLIGNGYMGASFFGGIATEKILLNEKTFWTGGPISKPGGGFRSYNGGNMNNRHKYVKQVQETLDTSLLPFLTGAAEGEGFGAYQCLGEVYISFHDTGKAEDYSRRLDLSTGIHTVKFAGHERIAFANYPGNVIVMKLSGGFELSKTVISGMLDDNGLRYHGEFRVVEDVVYFAAATDYAAVYPHYRSGTDPAALVAERLDNAVRKGYDALLAEHIADFSGLFNRVKIDVGDEKIENFFQFGRYLLISSSRQGSLPANLQGVWNESNSPPWCCDYHTNVNLQMNYWQANVTGLFECVPPLVEFLESMRKPGRVTAKEYYGIEDGGFCAHEDAAGGFVLHTQTNPFGWTAPGWDFYWGWSTAALAWLMQNLWEYYEFTLDVEYLRVKIYPIMREAAEFYSKWLIFDQKQGRLISSPSYSPEHGPVTAGNVYEQSLIEQFYADYMKACEVLFIKDDLYEQISQQHPLLKPYAVGESGELLEWFEQEESGFDSSKVENNHRHISHLLGLYPGKAIGKSPKLLLAAEKVLESRGGGKTGWAAAFRALLWARAGNGERAYEAICGLIENCTYENLLSFHPPFQIDGNFGLTAAIAEMLLQSHDDEITAFPAVPKCWKRIKFSGLRARGGVEVSAKLWNGAVLCSQKKAEPYSTTAGSSSL
jgi:alpha-L-fucosidase 2